MRLSAPAAILLLLTACIPDSPKTELGVDNDGDGFVSAETAAEGETADCDDQDAEIHPDAEELCDGQDNDCDGEIDEPDAVDVRQWIPDMDGDGFGEEGPPVGGCTEPENHILESSVVAFDCNDNDPAIHPDATEVCDFIDNDCDGDTDEDDAADASTWYRDSDGDGYGDATVSTTACNQPSGYVGPSTDCNESDASISPAEIERCDGVDNNCDGNVDGGVLGQQEACPGSSCQAILTDNSSAPDGAYHIDPDGGGPFQVYCDMTTDGGGWTLVMKQAANQGPGSELAVNSWSGWSNPGVTLRRNDASLSDVNHANHAYSRLTVTTLRMTASTTWVDIASGAFTRTINSTPYFALSNAEANQFGNLGDVQTLPWSSESFTDASWTSSTTGYDLCNRAGQFFNQTSYQNSAGGIKWGWIFNNECDNIGSDTGEGLGCCGNWQWYRHSPWTLYVWGR